RGPQVARRRTVRWSDDRTAWWTRFLLARGLSRNPHGTHRAGAVREVTGFSACCRAGAMRRALRSLARRHAKGAGGCPEVLSKQRRQVALAGAADLERDIGEG